MTPERCCGAENRHVLRWPSEVMMVRVGVRDMRMLRMMALMMLLMLHVRLHDCPLGGEIFGGGRVWITD